jgi:pyruvate/2-oxoglutarate dehydrogenase complex dihydrolipoamide acyltransferase (E2) component
MPVISIRIPQLGEGLQEALLVEFLKKPGEKIERDDPIYVMETDKATTEVESPYEGTLVEWTIAPGSAVNIGAAIGKIDVAEGIREIPVGHGFMERAPSAAIAGGGSSPGVLPRPRIATAMLPPRTRMYLKEKGLLDVADQIPSSGKKLMPADVDAYLAGIASGTTPANLYVIEPLPKSQLILNYRLARSAKGCIPVTVITDIDWTFIESARANTGDATAPSDFAIFCWAVVLALKEHPKFRSTLNADGKSINVFNNINLGVAVALPGDEMVTAVVRGADQLTANDFFSAFASQIRLARDGNDQADELTTISISNIGSAGMRIGIPAIVAPAVATLAIGESFAHPVPQGNSFTFKTMVTATLCFDHRIVNGIGAAKFMNDVKSKVESFEI